MEIYYCEKCSGKPYTTKLSSAVCPVCGSMLRFDDVPEDSLAAREKLVSEKKYPDFKDIIRPAEKQKENIFGTCFNIADGEFYYEYLGFEKTGAVDFTVRFILGNQTDENSVITKTPFISPKIKFSESIEMSVLERMRKSFENVFTGYGFEKDIRLFHSFIKRGDDVIKKTVTPDEYPELCKEDRYSERFFISYDYQSFGGINLHSPFRKNSGIFDEVKRVLDSRNEKYMDYMFFRARNGDNMNLNSFADTACVLFDDPHICLIRYERLMKEAQMTRM